jgi:predicted kinase
MSKLFLMVGLVGSGKSTWSERKVGRSNNTVIINRDKIRDMIHGGNYRYTKEIEDTVKKASNWMLSMYLRSGYDVILDETSLTYRQRNSVTNIAKKHNAEVEIVWCDETKNNLEYRMRNPRGIEKSEWQKAIARQRKLYELPSIDECDKLTRVSIIKENDELSFEEFSIS